MYHQIINIIFPLTSFCVLVSGADTYTKQELESIDHACIKVKESTARSPIECSLRCSLKNLLPFFATSICYCVADECSHGSKNTSKIKGNIYEPHRSQTQVSDKLFEHSIDLINFSFS